MRKLEISQLSSAEKLARLVPSPHRQLSKHGCCVSVPRNWRPRSNSEVLLLYRCLPFKGSNQQVLRMNFLDEACRLSSYALECGVEMTPWQSKKDDLATLRDISGVDYVGKGCRFVAVDLDGIKSDENYTAGAVALQLVGELIWPLKSKIGCGGFNFPLSGVTVGGCGKKGSNTCLVLSLLRVGKRTCLTYSKESLSEIGKSEDLRLITVRELDPDEY